MHAHKALITLLILTLLSSVFAETTTLADQTTASPSNDDWPMFRYDAAHSGATNSSGPTSMVSEVWSTGPMAAYLTSPAIVNSVVYMTGYDLIAFNESTGEIIWRQREGGSSPPIVENGVVYTVTGAFNATTGVEIWRILGGGTVAIANGIYYTVTRENENSNDLVIALDASTGEKLWDHDKLYGAISDIAIENRIIYFGTGTRFIALDAYTGNTVWETQHGIIQESSPAVAGGYIYFSGANATKNDYNLFYCLDALTGREVWSSKVYIGSSPAIANGCVYVGGRDGQFFAFNATNGLKIWNHTVDTTPVGYGFESSPAVTGDAVYVGADDGYLYAFNASTGVKLWSYKVGNFQHLQCSPAVANGRIYMGSENNFLIAFETEPATTPSNSDNTIKIALIVLTVTIVCIVGALLLWTRKRKN
jgi:outer membrane protein assembly factor BamB